MRRMIYVTFLKTDRKSGCKSRAEDGKIIVLNPPPSSRPGGVFLYSESQI